MSRRIGLPGPSIKVIAERVPEHTVIYAYVECIQRYNWLAERGFENSDSAKYALRLMQEYEKRLGLTR